MLTQVQPSASPATAAPVGTTSSTQTTSGRGLAEVTVNSAWRVPELPSAIATSVIEITGPSSSRIVTVASGSPSSACCESLSTTRKLSVTSSRASPTIGTETIFCIVPAGKLSVPLVVVKSAGVVAVPATVV